MKNFFEAITTRGPIGWFRRLFTVVRVYGHDIGHICRNIDALGAEVQQATHYIKKATKIHVDVAPFMDAQTTCVLIGRYRGKDHVQIFDLPKGDMRHMIDQLNHMQRGAQLGRIDAPHGLDATIKRELKL